MKVNLARALTVDGTQYFAGEQFVDDAVAEKLRGQDGVTFPDAGVATDAAPAFEFSGPTDRKHAKARAAELEKFVAAQIGSPIGAKTSPTSADKPAKESR